MKDFEKLYEMHKEKIFKYLYYLTRSKIDAEDLLQETFFQVYKNINSFKNESSVTTWIYGISKNVYYKWLRKEKNDNKVKNVDNVKVVRSPCEQVEISESVKNILIVINSLETQYKDVVILRIINELSFKEIGEIMNKNENWARVTYHRAKVKLGKELLNE